MAARPLLVYYASGVFRGKGGGGVGGGVQQLTQSVKGQMSNI